MFYAVSTEVSGGQKWELSCAIGCSYAKQLDLLFYFNLCGCVFSLQARRDLGERFPKQRRRRMGRSAGGRSYQGHRRQNVWTRQPTARDVCGLIWLLVCGCRGHPFPRTSTRDALILWPKPMVPTTKGTKSKAACRERQSSSTPSQKTAASTPCGGWHCVAESPGPSDSSAT